MARIATMIERLNPLSWPVVFRVPALVVLLMLAVGAAMTNSVLTRLIETQNRHLAELSGAYLDGLSSALLPHVLREDVWEVYDALERSGQRYKGLDIAWTTVTDPGGVIIASSQPHLHALQWNLPQAVVEKFVGHEDVALDPANGVSHLRRVLTYQDRAIGAIYAEVRISRLIGERWDVLATLVATNALLTLLLAAIGYAAVRRMLRPVRILAGHMREGAAGNVKPIPEHEIGTPRSEFGQLFRRYNSLVGAVAERERLLARLAEEERLVAMGRLASGMAHEINNPLGGMLNAVDALQRHGDREAVRETSLRLIEQGLIGIRDVVRSALATYRMSRTERTLKPDDLNDLAFLLQPEVKRKQLTLTWTNQLHTNANVPVVAMRDATLNLLLNACAAAPTGGMVAFAAWSEGDALAIRVEDDGPGLPTAASGYLNEPGAPLAPFEERGGLGLWMVKRFVHEAGGKIAAARRPGGGTVVVMAVPERRSMELRNVA